MGTPAIFNSHPAERRRSYGSPFGSASNLQLGGRSPSLLAATFEEDEEEEEEEDEPDESDEPEEGEAKGEEAQEGVETKA